MKPILIIKYDNMEVNIKKIKYDLVINFNLLNINE